MRIQKSFVLIVAILALFSYHQATAQSRVNPYQDGYLMGDYDKSVAINNLDIKWAQYLESPTQYNWDYYFGYYHAINGLPENAAIVPSWQAIPMEYSDEGITSKYVIVQQGTSRLATHYRRMMRAPSRNTAAGAVNNLSTTLDFSYASVDDEFLGGDADDTSGSFILNGMVGDDILIALGYTRSRYQIDAINWDQSTDTIDAYFTYQVATAVNVGAFLSFSSTDIEDRQFGPATVKGDSFDRWGGGLLASTDVALCEYANLGVIGTLASMNKSSIGSLGDDEDSAGIVMVDLSTFPTDDITMSLYGTYFTLLDREFGPDGSYFIFGAECQWKMCAFASLRIGYETTAADNDRQEDRYKLGLIMTF